jgi:hypothetical protein
MSTERRRKVLVCDCAGIADPAPPIRQNLCPRFR